MKRFLTLLLVFTMTVLSISASCETIIAPQSTEDFQYPENYFGPKLVGETGYAITSKSQYDFFETGDCLNECWPVPTYMLQNHKYIQTDVTVAHKTEVRVLDQDIDTTGRTYAGYLLVESLVTGEQFYINYMNYSPVPYWCLSPQESLNYGYSLAEFEQTSDFIPVNSRNIDVEIPNGAILLIYGRTGMISKGPNRNQYPIEARYIRIVQGKLLDRTVYCNEADLNIVY